MIPEEMGFISLAYGTVLKFLILIKISYFANFVSHYHVRGDDKFAI